MKKPFHWFHFLYCLNYKKYDFLSQYEGNNLGNTGSERLRDCENIANLERKKTGYYFRTGQPFVVGAASSRVEINACVMSRLKTAPTN